MVLVTGGTGLVGSHLLYFLLNNNRAVRAIHRKTSNLESVKKVFSYYTDNFDILFEKIEWVEANITDLPALETAFEGVSEVYHCAAYISFNPKNFHKLRKANVEGTANIVNLCLANKVHKLCHVSSIATFGESENDDLITEQHHWNPAADNSVYAITKFGAEMEVWRGTQEGLKAVIVNPAVILGEGHWNASSGTIIRMVAKGTRSYSSGGVAVVDVRDVVRAMLTLMEQQVENEQFILASGNMTYKELLSSLAENLNVSPPVREISNWKLDLLRRLNWLSSKVVGTRRKLLRSTVKSLCTYSYFDGSKIERHTNFSYTPIEKTFRRIGENYYN